MSEPPPPGADLTAMTASLQSDARDSAVFFAVLCTTLETALPAQTTVEHEHGLLKRNRVARAVTVQLGDDTFEASMRPAGLTCRHVHAVHGVGGGLPFVRELDPREWLAELMAAVARDAEANAAATEALRALTT